MSNPPAIIITYHGGPRDGDTRFDCSMPHAHLKAEMSRIPGVDPPHFHRYERQGDRMVYVGIRGPHDPIDLFEPR